MYCWKGSDVMAMERQQLLKLINEIPKKQIPELINFIRYLKIRNEINVFQELQDVSESSIEFWNNKIDDEVWNNA